MFATPCFLKASMASGLSAKNGGHAALRPSDVFLKKRWQAIFPCHLISVSKLELYSFSTPFNVAFACQTQNPPCPLSLQVVTCKTYCFSANARNRLRLLKENTCDLENCWLAVRTVKYLEFTSLSQSAGPPFTDSKSSNLSITIALTLHIRRC